MSGRRRGPAPRRRLVVLEDPACWQLDVPSLEVVSARDYLTDPGFGECRRTLVFNLCRTTGYQTLGYYVSLLGEARGHRPLPSLATLQDLHQGLLARGLTREMDRQIQASLGGLRSREFELSVYFGSNLARRHEALSKALYAAFPAPLLRASFRRNRRGWRLEKVRPLALEEVPGNHREFFERRAVEHLARPRRLRRREPPRFELALLWNPDEENTPSGARALARFERAGAEVGIRVIRIGRDEAARLPEFDALFLRETTAVDHHTYRMARRAAREGLIVVDDPESILRCTNKVFLAEVFDRFGIPAPRTLVVHQGNRHRVEELLGLPCVVKLPDSSFSQGVRRARTGPELEAALDAALAASPMVVVQEFVTSEFDWRVGVLGGRPLYACKYHLARGHWTIQARGPRGGTVYGETETFPLDAVPPAALRAAVAAARRVGDGLYGVDLKERDGRFLVMEVNDNPNLDAGIEDAVLGQDLYRKVMGFFLERLERRAMGSDRS